MNPGETFLTIDDIRDRLKCSRTTAWRLINERGLKALRSGGIVRVAESELTRWIERNSAAAGEPKPEPVS